jgi:ABC-type Mn2+/Zn2+ transport system ATPase subunit
MPRKRQKKIIIIAGPNGAGKSTFANRKKPMKQKKPDADTLAVLRALNRAAKSTRKLA